MSEDASTKLMVRGTVGILGGREVEEGYGWRVKKGLLYYCLKVIDRVY